MALNVGQLLAPPDGSLVGAVKQGTGVTIDGDGTINISGGGDFPLTTINFPTTIPGTANTTWADNSSLIYATGCIEFSINGGAFGQGARVIDTGDVLTTQWLTTPACGGAPHGTTIIGTITDSTYSESSTFTIDRVPNAFVFGDLTEQPLSSVVTSNPLIPSGFNTTTYVTLNAGNTLTSVQASAGGGAFTAIPASGTTLPLNPGQSLQIRGTTGGANNTTYSATVNLGVTGNLVSDAWDVTTVTVAASIAQPSILTPPSGTTGLNPALNTPAGITLTASSYSPLNGAGAQTSSDWEVYEGSYPLQSTNVITATTTTNPSWTRVNASSVNFGNAIVHANGKFWITNASPAGAGSGQVRYSSNGVAWATTSAIVSGAGAGVFSICSTGVNSLVALCQTSHLVASVSTDNGVSWSNSTIGTLSSRGYPIQVVSDGGSNVVCVTSLTSATTQVARSSDGGASFTGWTSIETTGTQFTSASIAYANGIFVVATVLGALKYSTNNGSTWNASATPVTAPLEIHSANGMFVLFDAGGIYTSTDGSNFTSVGAVSGGGFARIGQINTRLSYSGGYYFAGRGTGTTYAYSTDLATWTSMGASMTGIATGGIAVTPGASVLVGDGEFSHTTTYPPIKNQNLTIANCQTEGFLVGDTVVSNPAGGGPATILSLDNSQVTVTDSTGWLGNSTQRLTRDPNTYGPITGSPFTDTSAPFTTLFIPQSSLATSTNYFARVQYATTNTQAATSPFSAWSSFGTAASFAISPGTPLGGGYFGGQINDGGTIYNLVVAPTSSGSLSGETVNIEWRTQVGPDADPPSNNTVYGATTTVTLANAQHPAFSWCVSSSTGPNAGTYDAANSTGTGIGGYNDWYIPAKEELAVLYFFLKPSTDANDTAYGRNTASVAPYTPNTPYGPGFPNQTTSALFQAGNTQAFTTGSLYWSASQYSSNTDQAWFQNFADGSQGTSNKNSTPSGRRVRAIRRVAA